MMKQIILLFCSLMISVNAIAQKITVNYCGVVFKCKLKYNAFTVTSFDVKADKVIIPSQVEYKGKKWPVKSVDTFINGNNYLATALIIEEGIERIEKGAFLEFRKLNYVKFPNSIKHVAKNAFRNNPMMKFEVSNSVKEVVFNDKNFIGTIVEPNSNIFLADIKASENQINENKNEPADNVINNKISKEKLVQRNTNTVIPRQSNAVRDINEKTTIITVDNNIPMASAKNEHTYCVIIANENYQEAPTVEYALNDGQIFREYCRLTLGIPEKQIRMFLDARYTDILKAIRFLENVDKFDNEAKIIFYYSGHGVPNETDRTAFLLPVDGTAKEMQTCVSLKSIYDRLGKIKSKNTMVFIDACFSGTSRGSNKGILAARSIVRVKEDTASGNMVIMTAASSDETAYAYKDAKHGLFTYHLLKELKESKGKIKLGDLFKGIKAGVAEKSVLENDKLQTPSVIYSPALANKWEGINF